MKQYFLNTLIGIFLGYLIGFLYISSIDKTLFDNHISNQNHFDQSFSGLLFPFILIWILFFHSEIKKRNLKKFFDIQVLFFLVGCFFGGYIIDKFGIRFCKKNLLITFHPVTLEKDSSETHFKALLNVLNVYSSTLGLIYSISTK